MFLIFNRIHALQYERTDTHTKRNKRKQKETKKNKKNKQKTNRKQTPNILT
jgi:hypothetical protein